MKPRNFVLNETRLPITYAEVKSGSVVTSSLSMTSPND